MTFREMIVNEGRTIGRLFRNDPRTILYLVLSGYVIFNFFKPWPAHPARALFVMLVLGGLFLLPPAPERKKYLRWLDYVWLLASTICFGYILFTWREMSWRTATPEAMDMIMGIVAIIVSIEATRRSMGWMLAMVVIAFLLYYFLGHYLPREFGGHAPFNLRRIISAVYMDTSLDGIFGSCAYVMFKYVFLIYMFGKGLELTGATGYLMDLARALVGTIRGGAGLVAVVGSSLVGSITGLATANVLITGTVTIPLMKKTGFEPEAAGGIESAASSGGQIMPPVMGLASFLMMAFLSVPYWDVIKAAILPGILYYFGVGASILFYVRSSGIQPVPRSEVPVLKDVLKKKEGLTFLGGFSVLVILIVLRYSPTLAALVALGVIFVLSFLTPNKMIPSRLVILFVETAKDFLRLGGIIGGIGIVIGTTLSTGLAFRITDLLLGFTGGMLGPTMILVMIACMILGMGLPPLVIYIVAVILMAPALEAVGITSMAAHLFCFYAAVFAEVTPPVAMTAYVASTIAGTKFWGTCLYGMKFAIAAYIIPYAFAMEPSLCLIGDLTLLPLHFLTAVIGVTLLGHSVIVGARSKYGMFRIPLFFIASILLIIPNIRWAGIGIIMAILGMIMIYLESRSWRGKTAM
ncbi:MAG: TRAP transporter fused permease subunit [Deltaproteobacteria bacterium]|nr:TRAP transporter fused permease subunit [Deltaproteobacteria bacterium]